MEEVTGAPQKEKEKSNGSGSLSSGVLEIGYIHHSVLQREVKVGFVRMDLGLSFPLKPVCVQCPVQRGASYT